MCKKLVLAAVAILVGTAVVRHTSVGSLAQVWWRDAKTAVERQVPPEMQIKQLEAEVNKIDRDIKQNLSRLAGQEFDTQKLEENVAQLRDSQTKLRADIEAMAAALKASKSATEPVAFHGRTFRSADLTRDLDRAVTKFESKKGELKSKEKLLDLKKQALEVATDRITAMADQKERLRMTIAKFESRLELNRLNAVRAEAGLDLDDSQVARCNTLANEIERRLAIQDKETEIYVRFGYAGAPKAESTKPTGDVVKAAEKALEETSEQPVAFDKK